MKKIYSLALLMVLSVSAFAQNIDLEVFHYNFQNNDTIKYNNPPQTYRIIYWGFVNHGPTALVQATDSIYFYRAYNSGGGSNRTRLILPASGLPVGDTVSFADTVGFGGAPSTNPFTWCDTALAVRSGTLLNDTDPSNNTVCKTIVFVQDPLSVGNTTAAAQGVTVFPNPASTQVNIKYNAGGEGYVAIRDIYGKLVYNTTLDKGLSGSQVHTVDVSIFSAGMYMIEVETNGVKSISKVTIQ